MVYIRIDLQKKEHRSNERLGYTYVSTWTYQQAFHYEFPPTVGLMVRPVADIEATEHDFL